MTIELRPLAELRAAALKPLLADERRRWLAELGWEHDTPAQLLCDAARQGRLGGLALLANGRALAYSYWSLADGKALLGGVHELPDQPDGPARRVLEPALDELLRQPSLLRVESQLLHFVPSPLSDCFHERGFGRFPRVFMSASLRHLCASLPEPPDIGLERLGTRLLRGGAEVVYASFDGSPEREMSDSYASVANCESFLRSVVLRHACGRLIPEASFLLQRSRRPRGLIVSSHIGPGTAHVVQLSVHPRHQGRGLGKTLVATSSHALRGLGYKRLTLSVSLHNRRAHAWYQRLGFEPRKPFDAWVWQREG